MRQPVGAMKTLVITKQPERAPVEAGVTVKLGLDVHARQITVCRQVDGRQPQPAQVLSWPRALEWMGVKKGQVKKT